MNCIQSQLVLNYTTVTLFTESSNLSFVSVQKMYSVII